MSNQIEGKVINILPEETGEGKNGPWRKGSFIVETVGKYPKKVCIEVWGDKLDEFALKQGESVNVSIEVESREYNNRWYTTVKAWRVEKEGNQEQPSAPSTQAPPAGGNDVDNSDLPF